MRGKSLLVWVGVAASSAGALALACGETTSDTTKTITGIVIRAETLTTGRGCGRSPSQVYKYAAVVFGESGTDPARPEFGAPVTASVFDCFADGAFVNVPPSRTGSTSYKIELFVYNEPEFDAKADVVRSAGTNTALLRDAAPPTWSTTCYATQVQDVQSLAVCEPLQFGLAGVGGSGSASVRLDTASFALEDGGAVACAPMDDGGAPDGGAPNDGGPADGGAADGGGDAADGGGDAGDGAAPVLGGGYGNVRVTPSARGVQGTPTTAPCPKPYVLDHALPMQTYSLDVQVFSPDGAAVVGRTTCSATARAGFTSLAICAPMR